jgi:hypothetical protein
MGLEMGAHLKMSHTKKTYAGRGVDGDSIGCPIPANPARR